MPNVMPNVKPHGLRLAWAAACLLAAAQAGSQPVAYTLTPERSWVHFEVLHFGTSTSRGRFGPVQGEVVLDRTAGRGELGLRINVASVDTGIPVFNARLKQADLLATEAFPEAYFVATRIRFEGARVAEVRGEFTLRGISQPLSLRASHFACRDDAGVEICGGDFEGELLRGDFGATFGLPLVGNRIRLVVQVQATRR